MYKLRSCLLIVVVLASAAFTFSQKPKPTPGNSAKPVIFAVLNDGSGLEPIGYVSKGKLETPAAGDGDQGIINAFVKAYYKPGTTYRLIFGGADAGTVKIKSANAASDCAKNMANVTTTSTKVTLKGMRMALATNAPANAKAAGLRRSPTAAERTEIEALVRAEYVKNKLTPKEVHSQNLTAIDVDGDGKVEFVGSYWVEVDRLTRALLFFIADRRSNRRYGIDYSEYSRVDQETTMSHDIKDVDQGIYNELFLDHFDVDGDGTTEVFSYVEAFEGADFNVYRRSGNKWTKLYTFSNYHCGY